MFDIFQQPWTLLIIAILGWFVLLLLHGDSRLWWQSHLVIFLVVAIFTVDILVGAGLFKFSKTLTLVIKAVLGLGIATLLTFMIIHIIATYERHRWQWFIPLILAFSAFGLDFMVRTDLERINALIKTARKACEQEDLDAIGALISENYSDSFHNSKEDLVNHCRSLLTEPLIETTTKMSLEIDISSPRAEAILVSIVNFERQSRIYRDYKQFVIFKIRLYLQKEPGKKWLIHRTEVIEIDRQPFKWRDIR